MKTLFALVFVISSLHLFCQELPKEVNDAFNKQFPTRDSIQWEKEINVFNISCFTKGEKKIVVYSLFGELREIKTPINLSDVPEAIIDAINEKHKEVECYDIYKVKTADNRELYELKTDTEMAGYLIRAYSDGRIHVSKKIHVFED